MCRFSEEYFEVLVKYWLNVKVKFPQSSEAKVFMQEMKTQQQFYTWWESFLDHFVFCSRFDQCKSHFLIQFFKVILKQSSLFINWKSLNSLRPQMICCFRFFLHHWRFLSFNLNLWIIFLTCAVELCKEE